MAKNTDVSILRFTRSSSAADLKKFISESDFIFHLAGVNRPQDEKEFDEGNYGLTKQLLSLVEASGRRMPVLLTSSTQAELNNSYGKSKKAAERALLSWSAKNKTRVYIYRLPNVFGKWCRPNYNSVVATFCNNIANNLPIKINDPSAELSLIYIDDVVEDFTKALFEKKPVAKDNYYSIGKQYKIALKELADKLYVFKQSRDSLVVPNFESPFERDLYATYLSYLGQKDFSYKLEMKHDDRGWLSEFIKSEQFGQVFISRTKPGITRGNHWHHTKVEKFLVIEGRAEINFRQIDSDKILKYRVDGKKLEVVDIPPGYIHSIKNAGKNDLITIFWADEIFNSDSPDTYYEEV